MIGPSNSYFFLLTQIEKYPTLFIYIDGHRKKEKFQGQRNFDELARYINKQLKLKKDGLPGCDKEFDKLANDFSKKSEEERKEAIRQIEFVIEDKDNNEEKVKTGQKYLRIMHKIQSQGLKFVSEEIVRLENLLDTNKKMSQSKSNDLQKNLNILKSFQSGRSKYDLKKDEF